ncbi:hypothetical protein WN51_13307 [Melipona quadrifasciata]|uniref:Uncharacterized protein n=1 Tax=Melipona quadrifasciata TaxID=166423 RepID=A0A0M9A2T0_9HYME|nr:hypothetical protein WN51_13307 [Melipona quadrifasciata]
MPAALVIYYNADALAASPTIGPAWLVYRYHLGLHAIPPSRDCASKMHYGRISADYQPQTNSIINVNVTNRKLFYVCFAESANSEISYVKRNMRNVCITRTIRVVSDKEHHYVKEITYHIVYVCLSKRMQFRSFFPEVETNTTNYDIADRSSRAVRFDQCEKMTIRWQAEGGAVEVTPAAMDVTHSVINKLNTVPIEEQHTCVIFLEVKNEELKTENEYQIVNKHVCSSLILLAAEKLTMVDNCNKKRDKHLGGIYSERKNTRGKEQSKLDDGTGWETMMDP